MITISKEALKAAVAQVKLFNNSKSVLPVLSYLYLGWGNGKLVIKATDLEALAEAEVMVAAEGQAEVLVSVDDLWALVNAASAKSQIVISKGGVPDSPADFEFDGMSISLNTLPVEEFPLFSFEGDVCFVVPAQDFRESLARTTFAADKSETRPSLKCVDMVIGPGTLQLVATDGFRLVKDIMRVASALQGELLVDASFLDRLSRAVGRGYKNDIEVVTSSDDRVQFVIDGFRVTTNLYTESRFPQFEPILDEARNNTTFVTFSANKATAACKLAQKMGWPSVIMRVGSESVSLSNPGETASAAFVAKVLGEMHEKIEFDPVFLLDAVSAFPQDQDVVMGIGEATSPVFMCLGDFTQVVMPMDR